MTHTLFNDIEDDILRTYNRSVMMLNIFEDNMVEVYNKGGEKVVQITGVGIRELKDYFQAIPEDERIHVYDMFKKKLDEKGYKDVN